MKSTPTRRVLTVLALALLPLLLIGCAAERIRQEGISLIEQGRYEEGMAKLEEAAREDPTEQRYRATLIAARERVVARLNGLADRALTADNLLEAETQYRRVLALDPRNERALSGLRTIERQGSVDDLVKQGQAALKKGDTDQAQRLAETALAINPRHPGATKLRAQIDDMIAKEGISYPTLKSKLAKPVSLEFRDANLKMVFDVLSRTSGVNFVFDKDVRSDIKATIFVKKLAVEDAIDLLLLQSQLEKRVINENTLMIFPNTPQKLKDFQDLVIKSFYVSNADVKQTLNMLKTILKTKDIYVDEKLNLLVMRDTPDAIRIAEKLITAQDIAEPEVVLDVEVLEVVRATDLNLGVQLPEQISFTASVRDNYNIRGPTEIQGTLNLRDRVGSGNILANPRIRVKNREKAKLMIGDRVPVISSATTPVSGTVTTGASNLVVSQSVQYLDVGLKLEVEPTIHLADEVAIKVNLEVNTLGTKTETQQGTVAYQVGTRTATTMLQIKDGETQTLGGLIRDDELRSLQQVPFIGDIPVLGWLFRNYSKQGTKTEIVLSITPRIVRNIRQYVPSVTEYVSGSESSIKARVPGQRPVAEADSVALRGAGAAPTTRPAPVARPAAAVPAPASAAPPPATAAPVPAAGDEDAADSGAAPPSAQPIAVTLQGSGDVKVGQEFLLTVPTVAEQPLVSTALQVSYDAQALRVVEVTEGDLMKQDAGQTSFSHKVEPATGKIFIGLSRAGGTAVTGRGNLVTIKFAAIAEKPKAPIQVVTFSGVGAGNKSLPATLPAPFEVKVGQ